MKHVLAATFLLAVATLTSCNKKRELSSATPTAAQTAEPTITATPNPVPAGNGPGKTTISWDTGGDGAIVDVYLTVDGKDQKLFATHSKNSINVDWISAGPVYEFTMYPTGDRTKPLGSVKVTRNQK